MINDMNDALLRKYILWTKQIASECKDLCGDMYSNPCCLGVPQNWESAKNRIMIVGKEGYGDWGFGKKSGWNEEAAASGSLEEEELFTGAPIAVFCDKTINEDGIRKLMRYNVWAVYGYHLKKDNTKFWKLFKQIAELPNSSVVWNNLDKIYSREKRNNLKYVLKQDERALLHSVPTKILREEIKILKPNIVVFTGLCSRGIALEKELAEVYESYIEQYEKDIEGEYLYEIRQGNVTYIACYYHPAARPCNKPKGYDEKILAKVESAMKK